MKALTAVLVILPSLAFGQVSFGGPVTGVGASLSSGGGITYGGSAVNSISCGTGMSCSLGSGNLALTSTGGGGGLTSFNTRTGPAITLLSADVTGALGFTPAGLASPAFTGTPTAPTQTTGDTSTALATDAFVATAMGNSVVTFNGRAGAVTLSSNDVTAALGFAPAPLASPTFTGTVTIPSGASITGFAPLASPTFTGSPVVPGYLTTASAASTYAPLAAPALTGAATLGGNAITTTSGTVVSGDCVQWSGTAGALGDTGSACGSGGGGQTAITSGTAILSGPATTGGQPNTVTVGTGLSFSSGTLSNPQKSYGFSSTGALTAPASTTAYSMAGAGSSCTLTPTVTGRAFVQFSGVVGTGTATGSAVGLNFQIAEGSGTAPANGAAATGTVISPKIQTVVNPNTANASAVYPFSHQAIVTGLTLGTAYWFDEQQESVATAAKFAFTSIVCTEVEF